MTSEFLLTSLVIVVAPGAGVLYTVSTGLTQGHRASVIAAFGCTLGILPHMLAAITGLAALLHASALAFQTLKYAGVAYLLYMAWQAWRERGAFELRGGIGTAQSAWRVMSRAVLVNILNPKLSIFFFAFLPQFVTAADPQPLAHMALLSGAFMAMTFVIFVVYGLFAAWLRRHVLTRPSVLAWMRRAFAGVFVALGAKLALSDG